MLFHSMLGILFSTVIGYAQGAMRLEPDAIRGEAVKQLTDEQADVVLADKHPGRILHPFGESNSGDVVLFDPFRDQCRTEDDSEYRLSCPGQHTNLRVHRNPICITEEQLCDNERDCPGGEDENPYACQFHSLKRHQGMAVERELTDIESLRTDLALLRQSFMRKKARGVRRHRRLHGHKKHRKQQSSTVPTSF